jgi:hypothetical protein
MKELNAMRYRPYRAESASKTTANNEVLRPKTTARAVDPNSWEAILKHHRRRVRAKHGERRTVKRDHVRRSKGA